MSLAEFGFPQQRLRTVSAQLRGSLDDAVAHEGSPSLGPHAWSEWTHAGYSPDRQPGQNQAFFDPCADLMSENDFDPSSSLHAQQRPFQHGLGFEVQMQMAGIEEEPAHAAQHSREASKASLGTGADPSHFLARQDSAHSQLAQAYPASNPGSPARSRASSLQSAASTSLQMTALTSPASPFFPNPLPSPFHDHRGSFSSTIDPSQSLRGSSPSDSSSVSNLNMSRIESSSATSSVYGGDSASTAPSTPYRSGSLSRQNSQRDSHQKHARRRSSPIKCRLAPRSAGAAWRRAVPAWLAPPCRLGRVVAVRGVGDSSAAAAAPPALVLRLVHRLARFGCRLDCRSSSRPHPRRTLPRHRRRLVRLGARARTTRPTPQRRNPPASGARYRPQPRRREVQGESDMARRLQASREHHRRDLCRLAIVRRFTVHLASCACSDANT
ncbi:hypothetical protein AAT19DRAFT_10805 [Rhodotorula toruloides]|uniref:Uncharacterized protein n=1 Tax=Rhodotorula toruloides TaxID=5286 RepID=A0A2S9ZY02_RHOTO|nr:hypothetical protein AAT19DRAFT_10805 [Rhodotorula toruloides]